MCNVFTGVPLLRFTSDLVSSYLKYMENIIAIQELYVRYNYYRIKKIVFRINKLEPKRPPNLYSCLVFNFLRSELGCTPKKSVNFLVIPFYKSKKSTTAENNSRKLILVLNCGIVIFRFRLMKVDYVATVYQRAPVNVQTFLVEDIDISIFGYKAD